jgi:hypothetical protein
MRTSFFVPVFLVILLAAASLTTRLSWAQRAADECVTKPGSPAPQGSHWYFRVNRSDRRHCWYVGPEGAKVHTPVRRAEPPMPPGPISPVTAERRGKTTPAEIKVSNSGAAMDFAMRWPDIPRSSASVARKPSSESNSYAEELMAEDFEDDMPLIWPILTAADLAAASPSPPSAVRSKYLLALLAGALAFAAAIIRSAFKPVAAGRLGWSGLGDQRCSAWSPNRAAPVCGASMIRPIALLWPATGLHIRQAGQMRANRG